ncbi:DUF4227 domain-containing protein [Paenibacillus sp. CAA11]|uniref:DUF4227 family protein n=1 Tax=Paenibacillus sp. CAA11 TaxID=1532905 RepID=UPI000D34ABE6|nr:DUF4227 family protein [Paenibacillus sp. CAA11]AWB45069.1 DUF4227 domain-containing protein [Paenibacillus sp. CAA11]
MVISVRKGLRALRFLIIFVVLVYVLSKLYGVLGDWTSSVDKYRYPEGSAVKAAGSPAEQGLEESLLDRLKLFYRLGE